MLDTAKTEGGDDWDVGPSKLNWKAAAQLVYDRLGGKDVLDPQALDKKVDAVRASLASYRWHVASFGVERPAADELSALVLLLSQYWGAKCSFARAIARQGHATPWHREAAQEAEGARRSMGCTRAL